MTLDPTVDGWKYLETLDGALDEKTHKTKGHTVFFLKTIFVLGAQCHDSRHVDLIEGREDGGSRL